MTTGKTGETTRRRFMEMAAMGASGLALGRVPEAVAANPRKDPKFMRSVLIHLGSNMWDDFPLNPEDLAKSKEEEAKRPNPMAPNRHDKRCKPTRYHNYLRTDDETIKGHFDHCAKKGLNTVFIDLGEGLFYPSHPELAVPGTWSVEKMRKELARIRSLGLEPCPKLNFSSTHDGWLKYYHRMLSTPKYYEVVADLIRDVVEIFDHPRLFHIGYDEEFAEAQFNTFFCVMRQGDLWWHDLNYTVGQVSKHGARPVMWADAIWTGREEFIRRASRDILMSNWYYRDDFSEKKQKWDYEFEKKGGWGETRNGLAGFIALEEGGFDQLPCGSNWNNDRNMELIVDFCSKHIDPSRLKGFMMTPWDAPSVPGWSCKHTRAGIDQLAAALRKHSY